MSGFQFEAANFLKHTLGYVLSPSDILCTSKLYQTEESWAGRPAWWIEIPLKKLENPMAPSRRRLEDRLRSQVLRTGQRVRSGRSGEFKQSLKDCR